MNRDEFLTLPAGTIFQDYEPYCSNFICVKGETLDHSKTDPSWSSAPADFWSAPIADVDWNDSEHRTKLMDAGRERDVPLCFGVPHTREGYVAPDRQFLVWSVADVTNLMCFLAINAKGIK